MAKKEVKNTKKDVKEAPKKNTKKVVKEEKKPTKKVEKKEEVKKEIKKEVKETKVEVKEKKQSDTGLILAIVGIVLVVILGVFVNLVKDKSGSDPKLRSGKVYAVLAIEGYDEMLLELDADVAPVTVTNFIDLANSGFYDGLSFHRIMKDFMMQGGDPDGNGFGGSDNKIIGEFTENGHENNIKHVKGTISMARGNDPDSASSQFFIVAADNDSTKALDGKYAAFGSVIAGEETIDKVMKDYATKEDQILPEGKRPIITTIREISLEELMGEASY